jgi:hyaluronate lyase
MHLINHDQTLQARKSWFCLADAVVALGAGIVGTDGFGVETVVENRNLHEASKALLVDGRPAIDQTYDGPRWAHLDGVGGYLFPRGGNVRVEREERTGSWSEINTGNDTAGSTTPYTRNYAKLVVEHGIDPAAGEYAYILLPGATAGQTARRAADSGVRVVANTATVQAVRSSRDGLTLANFWTEGTAAGITTDGPASVVLGSDGRTITVAVSDPSRTVQTLRLIVDNHVGRPVSTDDTVTVVRTGHKLVLDIAVGGSFGATHNATFHRV